MVDRDTLIAPAGITGNAAPEKERLSLVIVDSGMGGLSICAAIVEGVAHGFGARQVDITYFNAWPEENRGYNALPDQAERVRVFDAALAGVQEFSPDVVYIACNTLSVLYPQTAYSRVAPSPVVGIVDFGVDQILNHLKRRPDCQVIILGTLTTVASAIHRDSLIAHGIDGRRIVNQACDQLATRIEYGPNSPQVRAMIDDFIVQAAARLHFPNNPVAAAFCCTHFGYSTALFHSSLEMIIGPNCVILDPNQAMARHFLMSAGPGPPVAPRLTLTVVSRIAWDSRKVNAISEALQPISPQTAAALARYRYDPRLFTV